MSCSSSVLQLPLNFVRGPAVITGIEGRANSRKESEVKGQWSQFRRGQEEFEKIASWPMSRGVEGKIPKTLMAECDDVHQSRSRGCFWSCISLLSSTVYVFVGMKCEGRGDIFCVCGGRKETTTRKDKQIRT